MSGILLAHRHAASGKAPIVLPNIGDPFYGGFFAGVMDTTQAGAIPANDQSQSGRRFALIDLGLASEPAAGTIKYKTAQTAAPIACRTVWDGLAATQAMIAGGAAYPAAQHAAGYAVPDDGASEAYIPAMRELLAMYWVFKSSTNFNYSTAETASTFPGGTVTQGLNPSSDPTRPAFTATVPSQTSLAAWQSGGAQAFQANYYWASTEYSAANAWIQIFSTGRMQGTTKDNAIRLRLVRRLYL